MKRLRHILSAFSLLFCVSAATLWFITLSHPPLDFFAVIHPNQSYGLGTERGGLIGFLQQEKPAFHNNDPDDIQFHRVGFRFLKITSDGMRRWNLVIPLWSLTLLTSALPLALCLQAILRRRRRKQGQCPTCLYDLTGNVSGICPECGTANTSTLHTNPDAKHRQDEQAA